MTQRDLNTSPQPDQSRTDILEAQVLRLTVNMRVQESLIRALLVTHPDLPSVAKEFEARRAWIEAGLLGSAQPDTALDAASRAWQHGTKVIQTAIEHQKKRSR